MLQKPENGENTQDQVIISKRNLTSGSPAFPFCFLPSSLLPLFFNSLPQSLNNLKISAPFHSSLNSGNILHWKWNHMARTQMQAPSLTSIWLCTSHILAPGFQRLDDISGYFGCKTKIKPKKPVTITRIPGHLSICDLGGILGIHQHLRCCFSLHFSLFHASWSLSGHLSSPDVCAPLSSHCQLTSFLRKWSPWVRFPSMTK